MSSKATLVWFRQDLRVEDNPALYQASRRGGKVVPVFIWAPEEEGAWPPGQSSRWWLERSLTALKGQLEILGSRLVVRRGPSLETLRSLATEIGSDSVYWNRRYEPEAAARDSQVESALGELGIVARTFNSALLFEPWEVAKDDGTPYLVFSSFWKRCLSLGKSVETLPFPEQLIAPEVWPGSTGLEDRHVLEVHDNSRPLEDLWTPGTAGAGSRKERFFNDGLMQYDSHRDRPDLLGTSALSPHLHFGELGPRQLWRSLQEEVLREGSVEDLKGPMTFLKELGWREFGYHLLYHFPHTVDRPLRPEFGDLPWRCDDDELQAWRDGQTGYPLVDAGMRQLQSIGWIHNRVRMVVASFLAKHLLISWQEGTRWFWNKLVDADLANNTLGWQWTAGYGADAAPFYRIFNPVIQGNKFDPRGAYVRRWVPELAGMPDIWIHRPWEAPQKTLDRAGVRIGQDYPAPIVEHKSARQRALSAFGSVKRDRTLANK